MTLKRPITAWRDLALIFLIVSILSVSAFLTDDISGYIKEGISLCYKVIIGTVFPFMILSDFITSKMHLFDNTFFSRVFERIFKINGGASIAFILGSLCGFPIGVKIANELYTKNIISKDEFERLIGFSNNPSPAFIISGIGIGLLNSVRLGVLLYTVTILSSITVGIIFSVKSKSTTNTVYCESIHYNFTASVRNSVFGTISVCGFIIVFSVICGLIKIEIKNDAVKSLILPFIEISNSANIISTSKALSPQSAVSLIAFAISFSGLSVHLQAKSFISTSDVSMKRYYLMKLLSGILSYTLIYLLTF